MTCLVADTDLPTGLKSLDYLAIIGYLVLTFGIAVWFSRKQKSTEDFFVGGRRMPFIAVGLSILATLFSTISYLGNPGEMIKRGIGMFIGQLSLPLSLAVIAFALMALTAACKPIDKDAKAGETKSEAGDKASATKIDGLPTEKEQVSYVIGMDIGEINRHGSGSAH